MRGYLVSSVEYIGHPYLGLIVGRVDTVWFIHNWDTGKSLDIMRVHGMGCTDA